MIAVLLCAALPVIPAHAVDSGPILLTTTPNARSIAMGDIGAADNSDPSTIFFNPANVCSASRIYGLVAQQRFELDNDIWLRSANAGFSASSAPGSPLMVGMNVGYARLDYGNSVLTDTSGNPIDTLDTYEDVASITGGFGFRERSFELRLGGGVKMWRAHFDREIQATSFDAGVAATVHERYGAWNITPSLAAAMIDMGLDIQGPFGRSDPLPTRLNVGASLCIESSPCNVLSARVPLLAVIVQAEAIKPVHDDLEWGIGNELAVAQMLFVRTGVRRYASANSGSDVTDASWGAGVGLPLGHLRMRFDYGRQATIYDKDHMDAFVQWSF
jgi:hypothetical protein